jgi:hypothetical protein
MTARPGAQAPSAHPNAPGCLHDHWRRPVIALRANLKIVLAAQPVDFRKSVHTLSALVSEALHANPQCTDVSSASAWTG